MMLVGPGASGAVAGAFPPQWTLDRAPRSAGLAMLLATPPARSRCGRPCCCGCSADRWRPWTNQTLNISLILSSRSPRSFARPAGTDFRAKNWPMFCSLYLVRRPLCPPLVALDRPTRGFGRGNRSFVTTFCTLLALLGASGGDHLMSTSRGQPLTPDGTVPVPRPVRAKSRLRWQRPR